MKEDNKLIKEIESEVFSIPIIDTHEHIFSEEDAASFSRDFSLFFSNYAGNDLRTSGMDEEDYVLFQDSGISIDKKWDYFSGYWENIRVRSYCPSYSRNSCDL